MKNWTVRQRILASFAVIIAIMLLMAATAYVKMLTVEKGAYRVQDDAMPGMYFITLVRSSWTDNYLQTQELFGVTDDHELSKAEADSILASEERLDQQIASYQKTMNPDEARDHELLAGFLGVRKAYLEQHDKVLELYREKRFEEAGKLVAGPLTEHWRDGRKYLNELIELNKDIADRASENIVNAVDDAELSMLVTLLLAVVVAGICGFLLLRAITQPIQKIVRSLDLMAGGDLTARLNLGRRDEFGAIETGFNGMAEELKGLVSQAQRSSVQVTTSVTEIAATSKQQQATATETAATTTEIGATSREIAATSRDLVRTMSEVSGAAEQTSTLAGSGQLGLARMEETMHHVMGAADLVNAKLAILNEKAGNINQVVTTIVKVADQTNLLAERRHRGGESRRVRPRVRRGGHRGAPAGGPDRGRHLRHRADGARDPVGGIGRGDGHGQVLRGGPPRYRRGRPGRRATVADHPAGAGAGAAGADGQRGYAGPGYRCRADQPGAGATGRGHRADRGVAAPGQLRHR